MSRERESPKKKYPPEVSYFTVLKGMIVNDLGFHILMAILLITGLVIDLLGQWLGGWLFSIRTIAHGYVGTLFVIVFIVYLIRVALSKKFRLVLTATNYVDFLFYVVLTITGITMALPNKPWVNSFSWLYTLLSPLARNAPVIHVVTTYVWIVFSTIIPGGILHGIATVYLISSLKKRYKTMR